MALLWLIGISDWDTPGWYENTISTQKPLFIFEKKNWLSGDESWLPKADVMKKKGGSHRKLSSLKRPILQSRWEC